MLVRTCGWLQADQLQSRSEVVNQVMYVLLIRQLVFIGTCTKKKTNTIDLRAGESGKYMYMNARLSVFVSMQF